jgi:flavin reductase (DIM6/NTAB) family NADH-FMN oxidoreductase RutF
VNADAKKQVLRAIPYGLYALGVRDENGAAHMMTVNWVTQVSFEPPMLAVAVEREARSLALLRHEGRFALSLLPSGARQLAGRLGRSSASTPGKMEGIAQHPGPVTGAPVLDEATGWLECTIAGELPAGDHVLVLAEVVEAGVQRDGETLTLKETGFRYAG